MISWGVFSADYVEKLPATRGVMFMCGVSRSGFAPFGGLSKGFMTGLLVYPLGFASSGRTNSLNWWSLRGEIRQTAQVLCDGEEGKFIVGAADPAQTQAIKSEDALHMGEEHLDLLAFATGFPVFRRYGAWSELPVSNSPESALCGYPHKADKLPGEKSVSPARRLRTWPESRTAAMLLRRAVAG